MILLLSEMEKEFILDYCSEVWNEVGEQFTPKELVSAIVNDLKKQRLSVGRDEEGKWSLVSKEGSTSVVNETSAIPLQEETVKSEWNLTPKSSTSILPHNIPFFQANLIELASQGIIPLSEEDIDLTNPDPTNYLDYFDTVEQEIQKCLKLNP